MLEDYINLLIEKHISDVPTFMIAAYPSVKSVEKILKLRESIKIPKSGNILEPNELHCTLRWWKNHNRVVNKLKEKLNKIEFSKSITCQATRLEILGESLVIILEGDEIHNLFKDIDRHVQSCKIPASAFLEYKPHITLYNGAKEIPDIDFKKFAIDLDRITLVNNDDLIFWTTEIRDT